MSRPRKVVAAAVVAIALVMVALVVTWFHGMRPLNEQEILAADRVMFDGECPIPDGGSCVFDLRLPHNRSMQVQVVHRRPDFGGNPEFQEIRLYRFAGPDRCINLQRGSALEAKVLALLRAADISTNGAADGFPTQPTAERLRWLIERILDRKTKWGPTNALSR